MESNIHSNFIPHEAMAPAATRSRGSGGMYDIFTLLAVVLFVASATLAVGVFLYDQYLTSSAANKVGQLERAKAAFEPQLIAELTRLDDRMRAADAILSSHLAPTALLSVLEQLTLQTISFSNFELDASQRETATMSMQGVAMSVNSVALQADYLSRSGAIVNPVFSNINRQRDGIRFDLEAEVSPSALNYRNAYFGGQVIPQQQDAPAMQQAPAAPVSPFGVPEGDMPPQQ